MPTECPDTPLHPEADHEIEPPQPLPAELQSALDLGSDDDSIEASEAIIDDDEDDEDDEMNSEESDTAEAPDEEPAPFEIDFGTTARPSPINPFGGNKQMSSSDPIRIVRKKSAPQDRPRRLSMPQQSRLIYYIDEQLMAIQRKLIKYLSSREDPDDENPTEFGILALVSSLDHVVTLIWYSIFNIKVVPFVYHSNLLTPEERSQMGTFGMNEVELEEISPDFLFGQTNYLIKIMGDMVDYLEKFSFNSYEEIRAVLVLLAKLDNIISILIDEYNDNDNDFPELETEAQKARPFINNTEKVRIESIINRSKMLMLQLFDGFKAPLKRSRDDEDNDIELGNYEQLIGEIYEGILDRTSI